MQELRAPALAGEAMHHLAALLLTSVNALPARALRPWRSILLLFLVCLPFVLAQNVDHGGTQVWLFLPILSLNKKFHFYELNTQKYRKATSQCHNGKPLS